MHRNMNEGSFAALPVTNTDKVGVVVLSLGGGTMAVAPAALQCWYHHNVEAGVVQGVNSMRKGGLGMTAGKK